MLLSFLIALSSCAIHKSSSVPSKQTPEDVLALINKVNTQWQLANPNHGNAFWNRAAYHTGNMAAYALTSNEAYKNYSIAWATKNEWKGAKSDKKENWKYLKYGFGWEFSALLLTDCEPDYNLTFYKLADSDTSYIKFYSALNEKINIFQFVKNGDWKLSKITLSDSDSQSDETIFSFFKEFSRDTSFVRNRLSDNFKYLSWDKDPNVIEEMEFELKSFLNSEYLFELIYTDKYSNFSDNAVLYIKGESTGYHLRFYFIRKNGKWYLDKYENRGV